MIEAAVSLRPFGQDSLRKRGDILVVKPLGSPWGTKEVKHFLIVQWIDAALEAQLAKQSLTGEPYPVIEFPYAVFDSGDPPEMIVRSSVQVDVDALQQSALSVYQQIMDRDSVSPVLSVGQYATKQAVQI